MRKIILICLFISLLIPSLIVSQVSSFSPWKRINAALLPIVASDTVGSSGTRITKAWLADLDSTTGTIGTLTISASSAGDITITKADPSVIFNVTTATDTDFWVGVQDDAGSDDDDTFQIGDGTTPGTNPFLTIDTSGNVGIRTTTPIARLDINLSTTSSVLGNTLDFIIGSNMTTANYHANLGFGRVATTSDKAPTVVSFQTINATGGTYGDLVFGTRSVTTSTTAPTERMRIDNAGKVFINDTSNINMAIGLTINQGANDDEIFSLKSSDVAHGMTAISETDTYASFAKDDGLIGGLRIRGITDAASGSVAPIQFIGISGGAADTGKTASDFANIMFSPQIKSGTGAAVVGADGNLLSIRNSTNNVVIFDAEGTIHQIPGSDTSFDMMTAQVTGTPTLGWNEAADQFTINKGLALTDSVVSNTIDAITVAAAATTFAVSSNVTKITGDVGLNTVSTITGGVSGQTLTLIFLDALVTISDTNDGGANTIDISAAFVSADDATLSLVFDGTVWREIGRAIN